MLLACPAFLARVQEPGKLSRKHCLPTQAEVHREASGQPAEQPPLLPGGRWAQQFRGIAGRQDVWHKQVYYPPLHLVDKAFTTCRLLFGLQSLGPQPAESSSES
jgi:hypothetical protein